MQALKKLIVKWFFLRKMLHLTYIYITRKTMLVVVQQHQEYSDIKFTTLSTGHL